ncbi:MAG: amidase [Verrucomicrobia bacterium]|nr:amidase [Verrucomicrobiota bacterium]
MTRREFLRNTLAASAAAFNANVFSAAAGSSRTSASFAKTRFELDEATIPQLQRGMESRKFSAQSLTRKYLRRIAALDRRGPELRAVLQINPDALRIADALDVERKAKGPRGPLHGIPVLLKDNIDTADRQPTTAGSLALAGTIAPKDAFVTRRLREAGAVILGKANLSEWANIRSTRSSSGWSAVGGQTRNPYALDRTPSGSSSGSAVAVAANLCAVAVGTETDGSIVSPASCNSIVGIKPTVGLVSRAGIIPISHSQDTAGPMARTVTDAAILLNVLAGFDLNDAATEATRDKPLNEYTHFLDPSGLRDARLGVARKFFPASEHARKLAEAALDAMREQGATLIDLPEPSLARDLGDAEDEVLLCELKADLKAYLATRGQTVSVHSLKDVIDFNERNRDREMPFFGQELFLRAETKGPLTDRAYLDALAKCRRLSREEGIDAVMNEHRLDAVVAPTESPPSVIDHVNGDHYVGGCSTPAAVAGYPHITVPAGYVFGLPVGISFFGKPFSEAVLIKLAFAFEQATKLRRPPSFLPHALD